MERIVDDLLTASHLEVIPERVEREVLDMRKIVEGAVERAQARADLLAAEVTVSLPRSSVPVEVDRGKLGRVLDDLINNALTYTIRPPQLWIGLSTHSEWAIFRLKDNGVGISEDERERIFDRLYRVTDPQVVVPGIGLGLYISRQLVESYGGSLVIESSTPGLGSVFALALPLSRIASVTRMQEAEAS
jgi:signal transduction histidine kinase